MAGFVWRVVAIRCSHKREGIEEPGEAAIRVLDLRASAVVADDAFFSGPHLPVVVTGLLAAVLGHSDELGHRLTPLFNHRGLKRDAT